jgi:hypothetical protein
MNRLDSRIGLLSALTTDNSRTRYLQKNPAIESGDEGKRSEIPSDLGRIPITAMATPIVG